MSETITPSREKSLWECYRVRLDFITSLCGSVPGDPNLVRIWLESREPAARPPQGRSIDEIQEEVLATMVAEEEPSRSLLTFQRIDGHLVVRAATLRAHIKDCARQISVYYVGKISGEKAFSTRVINCVYPDERQYWIPILNGGESYFTEPSARRDKPVHSWQGNSLKTIEYVNNAQLNFRLKVLGGKVSEKDLNTIFTYGGTHGYGGERGDGEGRYVHQLTKEKTE